LRMLHIVFETYGYMSLCCIAHGLMQRAIFCIVPVQGLKRSHFGCVSGSCCSWHGCYGHCRVMHKLSQRSEVSEGLEEGASLDDTVLFSFVQRMNNTRAVAEPKTKKNVMPKPMKSPNQPHS